MNKLTKAKTQILDYIDFTCEKQLKKGHLEGISAIDVSNNLNIDRANTTRNLNYLFNKGFLVKIEGRPTLFISMKVITANDPNNFVPALFSSHKLFSNYLAIQENKKQKNA